MLSFCWIHRAHQYSLRSPMSTVLMYHRLEVLTLGPSVEFHQQGTPLLFEVSTFQATSFFSFKISAKTLKLGSAFELRKSFNDQIRRNVSAASNVVFRLSEKSRDSTLAEELPRLVETQTKLLSSAPRRKSEAKRGQAWYGSTCRLLLSMGVFKKNLVKT